MRAHAQLCSHTLYGKGGLLTKGKYVCKNFRVQEGRGLIIGRIRYIQQDVIGSVKYMYHKKMVPFFAMQLYMCSLYDLRPFAI